MSRSFFSPADAGPVGICDRCSFRYLLKDLKPDPNFNGLRVCDGCRDEFDPYRLPARQTENITLQYPRPDTDITDPSPASTTLPTEPGTVPPGA